jgi:UDP-glucuronate decarboxylase
LTQPTYEEVFGEEFYFAPTNLKLWPTSILVTGSQGMLGNAIAKALYFWQTNGGLTETKLFLASRQWTIKARKNWKESANLQLLTNSDISKIRDEVEVIVHTASPSNITQINSYQELHQSNVGMLDEMLTLGPKKIVYISSGEVYRKEPTVEGTHYRDFLKSNRRDWYPIVKLETEKHLEILSAKGRLEVVVLRLFHTFGPGVKRNDGRSFADILWGAALHQEIFLHSPGAQVRSFLYLSDAVDGILRAAFTKKSGYFVANLGSDAPVTIREFAEKVSSITGSKIKYELDSKFSHSPNDFLVPIIQNMRLYDWAPKIETKIGIERTINWIKNVTPS